MSQRRRYLDHADDADRLARLSATPGERAAYERIASVWRELAGNEAPGPISSENRSAPPRPD